MKINYSWIKEYVDVKEPLEEIAELLTMSGSEVKTVDNVEGDSVMDIEITPNRSDCLSYVGIAREISALTGKKIKMPPLKVKKTSGKAPFSVEIKDKELCPRYTARLIRDVRVRESPAWLKKRIVSMGFQPVNNVVDITNYVLFELGQPMHAFDYDKIKGRSVIIRRAKSGEKLTTIDQKKRYLDKEMLIIADEENPIAIGGVMGGLDTEVSRNTTNILLESAYFNPTSVRRTSFKLALASESSYRFERGVDPAMVLPASGRAALLIARISSGRIGELVDKGSKPAEKRTVSIRIERLNRILNLNLKESAVSRILYRLSLAPSSKKGVLRAAIPSFRQDIKDEFDLIEEIARIYGYDNIDTTIPRIVSNPERKSIFWIAREKAALVLASLGLNEVLTYSMAGKENMQKFSDPETLKKRMISVENPLSTDQEIMRASLIPGIVAILSWNINRGIKDLKVFEIGKVYGRDYYGGEGSYEKTNLCIALTGLFLDDWQRQKSNVTFFDLKGILETLFSKLGLEIEKLKVDFPKMFYKEKLIGDMASDTFDLKQDVFLAEISFDVLLPHVKFEKKLRDIPKYPSIKRDISLIVSEDTSFAKIKSLVRDKGEGVVEKIELLEEYKGDKIGRSLSFRIEYRDRYRTLTAEEVDRIHSAIRKTLVEKLGVTLR